MVSEFARVAAFSIVASVEEDAKLSQLWCNNHPTHAIIGKFLHLSQRTANMYTWYI